MGIGRLTISMRISIIFLSQHRTSREVSVKTAHVGIRRRFEQDKVTVNHTKFLGYDKDEKGNLIINEKQAKIVRRICPDYLNGKGPNRIVRELEKK